MKVLTLQMNKSRYICQAIILLPGDKAVEISKDFTILITGKTTLGNTPGNVLKLLQILTLQLKQKFEIIAIGVSSLIFCILVIITFSLVHFFVVRIR